MSIHPGFVAPYLSQLRAAAEEQTTGNNGQSVIVLKDVDRVTFGMFGQFAYRGDFVVPSKVPELAQHVCPPKSHFSLRVDRWKQFREIKFLKTGPKFDIKRVLGDIDYTAIFLSHAYVYVFAVRFQFQALEKLALHKLHQHLVHLPPGYVHHILPMIDYVYANTLDSPVEDPEIDKMRYLIVRYAACAKDTMATCPGFFPLLAKYPQLARDLVRGL